MWTASARRPRRLASTSRPLPKSRCAPRPPVAWAAALDRRPQQVYRLRPVHHQVRVRCHPSGSRSPRVLHDGQIRAKAPEPRQVRFEACDQNQIWEEIKNATNKRTAQRTVGQRASPRRGECLERGGHRAFAHARRLKADRPSGARAASSRPPFVRTAEEKVHELGIVYHIIRDVENVARANGVSRVSNVTLLLGEVSGVVPDLLLDAWRWAADKKPITQARSLLWSLSRP